MAKRGKNRKKPTVEKSDQKEFICPRCHGNRAITVIRKLKNGKEREEIITCDLCWGSGKKI